MLSLHPARAAFWPEIIQLLSDPTKGSKEDKERLAGALLPSSFLSSRFPFFPRLPFPLLLLPSSFHSFIHSCTRPSFLSACRLLPLSCCPCVTSPGQLFPSWRPSRSLPPLNWRPSRPPSRRSAHSRLKWGGEASRVVQQPFPRLWLPLSAARASLSISPQARYRLKPFRSLPFPSLPFPCLAFTPLPPARFATTQNRAGSPDPPRSPL